MLEGWKAGVFNEGEVVRTGLAAMLAGVQGIQEVFARGSFSQVVGWCQDNAADLIFVPSNLSRDHALDIRGASTSLQVVVFLRSDEDEHVSGASRFAADAYLSLDGLTLESLSTLLSRLKDGEGKVYRAVTAALNDRADRNRSQIFLTGREEQVLGLLVNGLSNRLISRELQISEHGVKRHVANILTKLNCPNRTLAATKAITEKLVAV